MKFEWVIPVIVVTVWIINAIVKSREAVEPVRPKRAGGGPQDGRSPAGDIDRFLQEIDRLRQKNAQERDDTARPVVVARARPVPAVTAVPRVRPVTAPLVESVRLADVPPAVVAAPIAPQVPRPAVRPVVSIRPVSPRLVAALNLLRSPQSIAAAIVLQEVLGPPKSRRR